MNVRKVLWAYRPKADGTCNVRIYAYLDGRKKYFNTGIAVKPADWDEKNAQVRRSHPMATPYNARIEQKKREIEEMLLTGRLAEKPDGSLVGFARQYLEEIDRGLHGIRPGTRNNYQSTFRRLREYETHTGRPVKFQGIDATFHHAFSDFLSRYCGCGRPGIGKHMKIIKRLMNIALERGLHDSTSHQGKQFPSYKSKTSTKIYLTEEEIEAIAALDLSAMPAQEKERDRFLVSYYFLLRFSDVVRIQKKMFFQQEGQIFLRIHHQKTGQEAIVPAKQAALDLLERYDYDLSFTSNQQANRELKVIAAMTGINESVIQDGRTAPKSSFVTTHTARRSAATNLCLNGFSLKIICDLGGWDNVSTLRLYLRASGLESAKLAAGHRWFE